MSLVARGYGFKKEGIGMGRHVREIKSKIRTGIAIVSGILLILIGLYFIVGISGETNRKNAKCTSTTTGTVTAVSGSGSKYNVTVDYVADDVSMSKEIESKKQLSVGDTVTINYEPLTVSHIYIEGVSPTGTKDVITGIVILAVGAAMTCLGFWLKKI